MHIICPECGSNEIVFHSHDNYGNPLDKCLECGAILQG